MILSVMKAHEVGRYQNLPQAIIALVVACNYCYCCLALSLGDTQLFQHMHENSGRVLYQKSCDWRHDHIMLRSQKVGLKLELL